jgi:Uma2 family endonuclease
LVTVYRFAVLNPFGIEGGAQTWYSAFTNYASCERALHELRMEAMMNATATLSSPKTTARGPVEERPLYEVVNGQTVELPSMGAYATWITLELTILLRSFVLPRSLGAIVMEMLFILDPVRDTRRRPDVAFVSAQRWPSHQPPPETGDWEVVPDLAVEVVSPNDLAEKVLAKMREYFRFGVRQVWIVYPVDKEIYIYESPTHPRVLTADDELNGGELLPGLKLPVRSLFQQQPQTTPSTG